jgi:hypothetical protein
MKTTLKPKRCKICKTLYTPNKPLQQACGIECAIQLAERGKRQDEAKNRLAERKKDSETRQRLKSKAKLAQEAQTAFNAWIRARDAQEPCISCGSTTAPSYHAGHYLSTGARPHLRYEPDNVHKQCNKCNVFLHGNLINYRINLIKKIGLERVEELENDSAPRHYTREALIELAKHYRTLAKQAN